MSDKKAVILQPGKVGDLIICSPIAKYYEEKGYSVEWFVYPEFKNFFDRIEYVKPIVSKLLIDKEQQYIKSVKNRSTPFHSLKHRYFLETARKYCSFKDEPPKKLLDICWGFQGSNKENDRKVNLYTQTNRTWIQLRYDLAEVPIEERWNFQWTRDLEKENELLKIIKQKSLHRYGTEEYGIVHNYGNFKEDHIQNKEEIKNRIDFQPIEGYQVYDWLTTLEHASTITCVDSSLCNFVEVCPSLKNVKKYYLGTEERHYYSFMNNILKNNWNEIQG